MTAEYKEIIVQKAEEIIAERWLSAIKSLADAMDSGDLKWKAPWLRGHKGIPCNHVTGRNYRGGNLLFLMFTFYEHQRYVTFKQMQALGGKLKPIGTKENGNTGYEKPYPVVFWPFRTIVNEDGEEKQVLAGYAKYYMVWNIEQVEWPEGKLKLPNYEVFTHDPISECEKLLASIDPTPVIEVTGSAACYSPSLDRIRMPSSKRFEKMENYYSILFHELTHWTGHESRLNRFLSEDNMRQNSYAQEELVAEFGALMLSTETGIQAETLWGSAAYLKSWHSKMHKDPNAVAVAMRLSQRAADFLLRNYEKPATDEAAEESQETKKTTKKKTSKKKTSKKKTSKSTLKKSA